MTQYISIDHNYTWDTHYYPTEKEDHGSIELTSEEFARLSILEKKYLDARREYTDLLQTIENHSRMS